MVAMHTADEQSSTFPYSLVENGNESDSFNAWRRLSNYFDPRPTTRAQGYMKKILDHLTSCSGVNLVRQVQRVMFLST